MSDQKRVADSVGAAPTDQEVYSERKLYTSQDAPRPSEAPRTCENSGWSISVGHDPRKDICLACGRYREAHPGLVGNEPRTNDATLDAVWAQGHASGKRTGEENERERALRDAESTYAPVGYWRDELDRLRRENEQLRQEKAERMNAALAAVRGPVLDNPIPSGDGATATVHGHFVAAKTGPREAAWEAYARAKDLKTTMLRTAFLDGWDARQTDYPTVADRAVTTDAPFSLDDIELCKPGI